MFMQKNQWKKGIMISWQCTTQNFYEMSKTKANFTSYEYQQMQRKEAIEALRKIKEKEKQNGKRY